MGENAFRDWRRLKVVKAPGLKKVGDGVFRGCEMLEKFDIPSVKDIGKEVFVGYKKLANFRFRSSKKRIWEKCFEGCEALIPGEGGWRRQGGGFEFHD